MAGTTTASDLFVEALENEGVERIFGIPGEENIAMLDSIRRSGIELYSPVTSRQPPSWQPPTAASPDGPGCA